MLGKSIPSWPLNPGPVFLQNFVKNKGDPLCYEVELIESNSQFAHVRFKDGKECTVSTKDLASKPCQDSASDNNGLQTSVPDDNTETEIATNLDKQQPEITYSNCRIQLKKQAKLTKCYRNQLHPIQDMN